MSKHGRKEFMEHCPYCGKAFAHRDNMKAHVRSTHGAQLADNSGMWKGEMLGDGSQGGDGAGQGDDEQSRESQ